MNKEETFVMPRRYRKLYGAILWSLVGLPIIFVTVEEPRTISIIGCGVWFLICIFAIPDLMADFLTTIHFTPSGISYKKPGKKYFYEWDKLNEWGVCSQGQTRGGGSLFRYFLDESDLHKFQISGKIILLSFDNTISVKNYRSINADYLLIRYHYKAVNFIQKYVPDKAKFFQSKSRFAYYWPIFGSFYEKEDVDYSK